MTNRLLGMALCGALVGLVGCGDNTVPMRDAMPDTTPPPPDVGPDDAGQECESDDECDDGVECTRDVCSDAGFCHNPVDSARCDDGVFCNGVEQCDPVQGCMPGPPETCNDDDVCTIDRCDEEAKICRRFPRDFDEDGEADWNCEGGTDCDDRDPRRGMEVTEVCDDDIDNDCDGFTDSRDPEGCGRQRHDLCDDALDVSAGGFFALSTDGASPDYNLSCAPAGRKDIVLTFTIDEPRSLLVRTEGEGETYVSVRSECENRDSEVQCSHGFPGQVRIRSLDPGTYFIMIGDVGGDLDVQVELGEAIPPPTNETCDTAQEIAPGVTTGTFIDVTNDEDTTCGINESPDLMYTFTLEQEQDVLLSVVASGAETVGLSVRPDCGDALTELRCVRGGPVSTRLYRLPMGTYFVIVEGSAAREFDFTIDLSLEDPSDEPPGDSCASPIDLEPGVQVMGDLSGRQDDHEVSCDTPFFYRDEVYRFELDDPSDVIITADGGDPFMHVHVGTTCGDREAQLRCVEGAPARTRLRGLEAGEYFVVVESFSSVEYTIELEVSDVTTPIPVDGNDNCSTAHVIPETGGLFVGDTTTFLNDYETRSCGSNARSNDVAFQLELSDRKSVYASTDGSSFDTVLHLHSPMCMDRNEFYCDDDGGESANTSVIEQTLNAGTYFFIVDGWGGGSVGEYFLEVIITDP